jgi:hypothetical protein
MLILFADTDPLQALTERLGDKVTSWPSKADAGEGEFGGNFGTDNAIMAGMALFMVPTGGVGVDVFTRAQLSNGYISISTPVATVVNLRRSYKSS